MLGGMIIEVCEVRDRPRHLWVEVVFDGEKKSVLVDKTSASMRMEIGDTLYWWGSYAYWTAWEADNAFDCNVPIPKVGFSGAPYPNRQTV